MERIVTFLLGISVSREFEESCSWATKSTVMYAGLSTITDVAHITTLHISHNGALIRLDRRASSRCKNPGLTVIVVMVQKLGLTVIVVMEGKHCDEPAPR